MSSSGSGSRSGAAAIASADPTGSATLRNKYVSHLNNRWRRVFGRTRQQIETNPNLSPTTRGDPATKIGEFDTRLQSILDEEIIVPTRPASVAQGRHYSGSWVRDAYVHGLKLADAHLNRAGFDLEPIDTTYDRVIRRDPHRERLHRDYRQAYGKLKKAGTMAHEDAVETYADKLDGGASIARTISDPRTTHDGVNDRLRKMGKSATKLSGNSVIVETINDASLERYAEAGAEYVAAAVERQPTGSESDGNSRTNISLSAIAGAASEQVRGALGGGRDADADDIAGQQWLTAGDDRVCEQCQSLEGNVYAISEIRAGNAPMPVRDTHMGCRCQMVVISQSESELLSQVF